MVFCGQILYKDDLTEDQKKTIYDIFGYSNEEQEKIYKSLGHDFEVIKNAVFLNNVDLKANLEDFQKIVFSNNTIIHGRVTYFDDIDGLYLFRNGKWNHYEPVFFPDLSTETLQTELESRGGIQPIAYKGLLGWTTDQDLVSAEGMNVIASILEEMEADDEDRERESEKLLNFYQKANPKERAILDTFLTFLCGWTMHSIIERN